jgi:hypothetical protein
MRREYKDVTEMIKERLSKDATLPTQALIDELKGIREKGYLTRSEFLKICDWKSSRPRRLYESNSAQSIRKISEKAFAADDELQRMETLTSLNGVGIPVGSAILTLTDPASYGILDIRVWQLLYLYGSVSSNPYGRGFSLQNWIDYLNCIRMLANEFETEAYRIEIILFDHHKEIQVGTLYKN